MVFEFGYHHMLALAVVPFEPVFAISWERTKYRECISKVKGREVKGTGGNHSQLQSLFSTMVKNLMPRYYRKVGLLAR